MSSAAQAWGDDPADIAYCPEHGLHGARDTCFVCGAPVEQIKMIPVATVARAWRALKRQRDRWMGHAIDAGLKAHELRRGLVDARQRIHDLYVAAHLKRLIRDAFA